MKKFLILFYLVFASLAADCKCGRMEIRHHQRSLMEQLVSELTFAEWEEEAEFQRNEGFIFTELHTTEDSSIQGDLLLVSSTLPEEAPIRDAESLLEAMSNHPEQVQSNSAAFETKIEALSTSENSVIYLVLAYCEDGVDLSLIRIDFHADFVNVACLDYDDLSEDELEDYLENELSANVELFSQIKF